MLAPSLRCAALSTLPLAAVMAVTGLLVVPVLVAMAVAFLIGPALHEMGHALALRGTPAALVTTQIGAFIAHGPATPARIRRIALAGPCSCLAAAAGILAAGVAVSGVALVGTGMLLSLQAASLTVLSSDGRNALAGLG
jgi:hypothetical protein